MAKFFTLWDSVPGLIQGTTLLLVISFLIALSLLLRDFLRAMSACRAFGSVVEGVREPNTPERGAGVPLETFNRIEERARRLPEKARRWWDKLADAFVDYPSGGGRSGFLLTRPASELLAEDAALGPLYHSAFHHSVPGILTGVGLAATFTAILLALIDVRYDAADKLEPVKGIAGLINGLSAKFLSSIVAIALAVAYTVIEKVAERFLTGRFHNTLHHLGRIIPVLTPERILMDIRKSSGEQAKSMHNVSADVVDRLKNVFTQHMSPALASGLSAQMVLQLQPTLDRMNATLLDLKAAFERLEQQKQESMTGELRGLLETLQVSMQKTLVDMGRQFHDSLSGAARDEFGSVQGSLHGTATLLEGMNSQFATLQASLATVVENAAAATTGQASAGRAQTEAMTALMNSLMRQLQESSSSSVDAIGARLTLVVDDLSRRVGGLSEGMIAATREFATSSQESAGKVIEQAGTWSEATASRLEALVASIEARSSDFEKAGQTLLQAQTGLAQTVSQNHLALKALHDAGSQVAVYATSLAGQTAELKNLNAQHAKIVAGVSEAAGMLRAGMQEHQQLLQQHDSVLGRYDKSFADLEQRLDGVLKTVLRGLESYSQTAEANFSAIVKMTNDTVPDIATILQAQTQELQERLEELNDLLEKGLGRLEGVVGPGPAGSPSVGR